MQKLVKRRRVIRTKKKDIDSCRGQVSNGTTCPVAKAIRPILPLGHFPGVGYSKLSIFKRSGPDVEYVLGLKVSSGLNSYLRQIDSPGQILGKPIPKKIVLDIPNKRALLAEEE